MDISINLENLEKEEKNLLFNLLEKANKEEKTKFTYTKQSTDRCTWAELREIIANAKAREFFGGNGSISVNVDGYGDVVFDIIGYDNEKLAELGKKHSITLLMHDLVFEPRAFNEMLPGEDGWDFRKRMKKENAWYSSSLRKYLHSDEFWNRFEKGFTDLICPVIKGGTEETIDEFFLLSREEVEGDGYEFLLTYKDAFKTVRNNMGGRYSECSRHWLREVSLSYKEEAYCIEDGCFFCRSRVSEKLYFAPACVLAV